MHPHYIVLLVMVAAAVIYIFYEAYKAYKSIHYNRKINAEYKALTGHWWFPPGVFGTPKAGKISKREE